MKNLFIAISIIMLSACNKKGDWTCTCEYDGMNGSGTKTDDVENVKRNDAENACKNWCESSTGGNGTYKWTLKAK